MRFSLPGSLLLPWKESPLPPKIALLLAVAGVLCIVLSTLFGVSALSDWLLLAAQALLALGAALFTVYVAFGVIRDAREP
jgi:drug/metabolite transporter (DMT)-like permease